MRVWIFNHVTYEFLLGIFNKRADGISCHKGVDYRVGFSAWNKTEISYHCKVFLVGKFLPLKVGLTTYISFPKKGFFSGNIISYHRRLNFHLCIVQELKSLQPALMRQVTCHIRHTRNFNFACNINQGPRYSHALSLQLVPQPPTNRMSINYGSYPFRQWISPSNSCSRPHVRIWKVRNSPKKYKVS